MQEVEVSKFRGLRESLGISREKLARMTRTVSVGTIKNAEEDKPIRRTNAQQLLAAINKLLKDEDKPAMRLSELGIRLQSRKRSKQPVAITPAA